MRRIFWIYSFAWLWLVLLLLIETRQVHAVPVDAAADANATSEDENATNRPAEEEEDVKPAEQSSDLVAGSRENTSADAAVIPDRQGTAVAAYEQGVYAGLVPAEALQQYYGKFNAAYSPFYASLAAPLAATYAAPAGYAAPLAYPTPYVVQTDYDGFLLPSTDGDSTAAAKASEPPLGYLRSLVATFVASSAFRVLATIVSAVGVLLFGGAITTAICSFTPICDFSFKAASYLRRHNTERVARTLLEEVASERVRRATEFVWKAIRKYSDMQNSASGRGE